MTAEAWWTLLIKETLVSAGAEGAPQLDPVSRSPSSADPAGSDLPADVETALPTLGPRLLQRFASREGYREFPEAHGALEAFRALGVKTAVLSNADDRIRASLSPRSSRPPRFVRNLTDSFLCYPLSARARLARAHAAPDRPADAQPPLRVQQARRAHLRARLRRRRHPAARGAHDRRRAARVSPPPFLRLAGLFPDEAGASRSTPSPALTSDYRGGTAAGLHALLLRRAGDFSDGATRSAAEDLAGVRLIAGLEDAVAFVKEWNAGCE